MFPDIEKKRHRTMLWVIRILGFLITCYVGFYIFAQSVPYEPYQVKEYNAFPTEVCVGETIRVDVTRYVDPDGNIRSITTRTSWEATESGVSTGITEYVSNWNNMPDSSYGIQTVQSPILRELPEKPGEYRIVSEYDVRGKVLLWERVDTQTVTSDEILEVLDESSEQCT